MKNLQRIEPGEPSKGAVVGSVLLTWEVDDHSIQGMHIRHYVFNICPLQEIFKI